MFGHRRITGVRKGLAILLTVGLLSGCATKRVDFSSAPLGATVVVGGRRGTTPCTLKVPKGEQYATFSLPSGEETALRLPRLDNDLEDAAQTSGKVLGKALKGVGMGVMLVGGGIVALVGLGDETCDNSDVMLVGLIGIVGGFGFYGLGEWIDSDDENPSLHADFGWSEEELYEDKGYGARRMKNVAP